ncbi:MAG: BlaI/MecI/CopY family transcriptional regulator [candidate division Zixibacteria bacterium]|nr:BlaI/MecI/CopY family transcriptional regulator [candidate division Zixibacteria bacterium]
MSIESFYFNPYAKGAAVFLGPTEALLMELAWEKKSVTVKQALYALPPEKELRYTTVMTVLGRLAEKALLKRRKQGRVYVYEPALSRDEFIKKRLGIVVNCSQQFK